jgi:hypothetical protein
VIAVTPGTAPADLIPGNPEDVERVATRLVRVAASAHDAAAKLDTLDADVWTGDSAQVYRAAIGDVPVRLTRAAAAFASAAQALSAYARALRDGQATAAAAVRMVERATPDTLNAEQQSAAALVARAADEVESAGRLAAQRLARAEADAPTEPPAGAGCDVMLRVDADHELTEPDRFVSPPQDWGDSVADMRYTASHEVTFAGSLGGDAPAVGTGDAGWQTWAGGAEDRSIGVVEAGTVAAAGAAVVAAPLIGRRRDRTALGLVGLDEAELRRRRSEFGGARHRQSALVPARAARLGGADAWRTRLVPTTRTTGTVHHWTGSGADPLQRAGLRVDRSGSVDRDVRGAVLRTGRPAHELS